MGKQVEKRTETFQIVLSPDEKDIIAKAAQVADRSMASLFRQSALARAKEILAGQ